MLWDIIRDFFVQYIFGGTLSDGESTFYGMVGALSNNEFGIENGYTDDVFIPIGDIINNNVNFSHISFGDWLSTTATIITMVGFCIFLFLIIRWFFRIGSSLISYR